MWQNQYYRVEDLRRNLHQLRRGSQKVLFGQFNELRFLTLTIEVIIRNESPIKPKSNVLVFPVELTFSSSCNHVEWIPASFQSEQNNTEWFDVQ